MQRIRIKCLPGSSFKLSGSHFKKNIKKIKKVVDIFCPLLYTNSCVTERTQTNPSGCGSAWLERLVWDQEVAGSNPVTPIVCGCSSMVEPTYPAWKAGVLPLNYTRRGRPTFSFTNIPSLRGVCQAKPVQNAKKSQTGGRRRPSPRIFQR